MQQLYHVTDGTYYISQGKGVAIEITGPGQLPLGTRCQCLGGYVYARGGRGGA